MDFFQKLPALRVLTSFSLVKFEDPSHPNSGETDWTNCLYFYGGIGGVAGIGKKTDIDGDTAFDTINSSLSALNLKLNSNSNKKNTSRSNLFSPSSCSIGGSKIGSRSVTPQNGVGVGVGVGMSKSLNHLPSSSENVCFSPITSARGMKAKANDNTNTNTNTNAKVNVKVIGSGSNDLHILRTKSAGFSDK